MAPSTHSVGRPSRIGNEGGPLLEVSGLSVAFRRSDNIAPAVSDFGISVERNDSIAVVGESGSGKSVSMRAIMGLYGHDRRVSVTGSVIFDGTDISHASRRVLRNLQGERISLISQDALASLNPSLTVGYQLTEPLRVRRGWSRHRAKVRAVELLDMVGIPSARSRMGDYPHQFSGGMRQRVLIASGLALEPDILIADEPTTALDVTIQAQVLQVLRDIRRELGMSLVMITHDMGVVAEIADRVSVMYAGSVVEAGTLTDVFEYPKHPYTTALLQAVPRVDRRHGRLVSIPGSPPSPEDWPSGCAFHPRCKFARDACRIDRMSLERISDTHFAACPFWEENDGAS